MADISKIKTPDGTTYDLKDTTARANSGVTGVKGASESSYRTGNVNLTPANIGAAPSSHTHIPTDIVTPSTFGQNGMNVISGARIGSYMSNKSFALPADSISIEYSNDGGATWNDYGATDSQKKDLFTETRASAFYIGKSTTASAKSLNDQLRVTISATDRYVQMSMIYLWYSTQGNTSWIDLYYSKFGDPDTFIKVFENQQITGWYGHNLRYFSIPLFGGSTNAGNTSKIRVVFKMTVLSSNYPAGIINDIRFYGDTVHASPNNMVLLNHLYSWNRDLDATFPAKITATQFDGNATSATNLMAYSVNEVTFGANSISAGASTNDKVWINYRDRIGGSTSNNATKIVHYYFGNRKGSTNDVVIHAAKFSGDVEGKASNVTGTVAVANGGTGKTTANDAADNLISGLPAWTANPTDDTYFVRQDTGGTSTFGRVKFSTLWNYIKGKFSGTSPITFSNGTIGINTASTSAYGATKLSTATNSTATDLAATPSAVKTAYDLANTANGTANTALSGVNGTLIYDHTYSISNGVATFTAHVYQKGVEVTNNYADSCFEWSYKLASAVTGTPSVVSLGTGKTKTITISTLGYGGYVLGTFTPPSE